MNLSTTYGPAFGSFAKHGRWVENPSESLRFEGFADEVNPRRVGHTGWFCDEFCEDKARGCVVQLPARKGIPQYYGAVMSPWDSAVLVDFDCAYADSEDAALAADDMAERFAEVEREWREQSSAALRHCEIKDEIYGLRESARLALAEFRRVRRAVAALPSLCSVLRRSLADNKAQRARLYAERKAIQGRYSAEELAEAL